jgi:pyruvate dehydrogenase E2 component (dihydrolipoamide acetyltransferase)
MRRAIARRLTESSTTVPHFTVTAHCRMDALLDLRRQLNTIAPTPISVNDVIVKAVGGAMSAVPSANAIWNGDSIRQFSGADVAIAVAIEGGLVTPVLRGVDRLSLSEIATATRDLAERARAGRLKQAELEGGTFTVSNLGMLGVEAFTAIINPPHSGILAVGAAGRRAVVIGDEVVAATVMTVTLSADHRVLDGAMAGEWMAAFTRLIEEPLSLLI